MRIIVFVLTLFLGLWGANTKSEIAKTNKAIKAKNALENELLRKVDELGSSVKKGKTEISETAKKLDELQNSIEELSQNLSHQTLELQTLSAKNASLKNSQKQIEDKITDLISNEFSLEILQNANNTPTTESVMRGAIFDNLNDILNQNLRDLFQSYELTTKEINSQNQKISQLQADISNLDSKKTEFEAMKQKQISDVEALEKDKEKYIKQLETLHAEQEALAKTLQDLKIIDDKEEREKARIAEEKRQAKELAEQKRKEELAKKQAQKSKKIEEKPQEKEIEITQDEPKIDDARVANISKKVKQYGSSYQASKVRKYSGAKTISPLENAYVKRKFGNYTDPVYNIKIFNESVVLGSRQSNAKVRNVLNGEVIFVKDTAVLGKVIIIKHSNNLHTIYAHLSQIAPTIKVGSVIKKGYTIGRVNNDLTFEVTQANHHINPLDLVSL